MLDPDPASRETIRHHYFWIPYQVRNDKEVALSCWTPIQHPEKKHKASLLDTGVKHQYDERGSTVIIITGFCIKYGMTKRRCYVWRDAFS